MRKREKSKAMTIHVINRFKERFNYNITEEDVNIISRLIRNGSPEVEHVLKQSNTRQLYKVHYKDLEFLAVYHTSKHLLCTVMPVEWLNEIHYTQTFGSPDSSPIMGNYSDEILLTNDEKEAINKTITSISSIIKLLELTSHTTVLCGEEQEEVSVDDLNVCSQILNLLSTSTNLDIGYLQND